MPTYKLKNRQLQESLDKISCGDFSRQLKNAELSDGFAIVTFGGSCGPHSGKYTAFFNIDEELLEEIAYNPFGWNEWPAVNPPCLTAMRVETVTGLGKKAFWDGCWREYGTGLPIECQTLKFRSWDDAFGTLVAQGKSSISDVPGVRPLKDGGILVVPTYKTSD